MTATVETSAPASAAAAQRTVYAILIAISVSHLINDTIQSLITASYPVLKEEFALTFGQIGLLTFVFQGVGALLQPVIGFATDKRPQPFSLVAGMGSSLLGLLVLANATGFAMALTGAGLIGLGSAVFHPESSRVARMASGGRYGLAQSIFQIGGNFGTSLGPLLAAFIVVPVGMRAVGWFALLAMVGMGVLLRVGFWYSERRRVNAAAGRRAAEAPDLPAGKVRLTVAILLVLIFSKYVYMAAFSSYYTFYLIETFHVEVQTAQVLLFVHLGGVVAGTLLGGPLGDKLGRKVIIWISIAGILPFTLALPHVGLEVTAVLSAIIGFLLASAFPAIVVYAQELMPGRVGTIAGLFFGFAFGVGAVGAAALGHIADLVGIHMTYEIISVLPALGLLAYFLPDLRTSTR